MYGNTAWIPFFEQVKLTKCCIIYKRLQGHVPTYLKSLLKLTSDTHSRQTRYANFNIARPVIKRKTEGGRTFTVTACQAWNSLPLLMRKIASLNSFRNSLWKKIFEEQQHLNHFILWFFLVIMTFYTFNWFYLVSLVFSLFVILSHSLAIVLTFIFRGPLVC